MPRRLLNATPGVVLLGSDFKALGIIRSLGRRGIPSAVIDNVPRSAWFSRYVWQRLRWRGSMEGNDFLEFLLAAAHQHHWEHWVLIPAQDDVVELVARHTAQLASVYTLVTQEWETVQWAQDKRLTHRLAEGLGIPYPRTWYPADEHDLGGMDITFPAIVKPSTSIHLQHAMRLKALPARDQARLPHQYRVAASILRPEQIMVQEIIPGDGHAQFSVGTFCKEGAMLAGMTARRTRQYPIDYGLSSSFVEAVPQPLLLDYARTLIGALGVSGMVEIEFKYDARDGQYKLLDINVRPWGWHALCIACGLDLPYALYRGAFGHMPIPMTAHYTHRWMRVLTDVPAGLQEMWAGTTSPWRYARSLAGPTVFSVLEWHDPLPVLGDLGIALYRLASGRRNVASVVPPAIQELALSEPKTSRKM